MPSRGLAAAQAVTRTIVSPERTTTAPSACLASRPVSIERVCVPTEMFVYACACRLCELRQLPVDVHARLTAAACLQTGVPGAAPCRSRPARAASAWRLLADAEPVDQVGVAVACLSLQVVEQPATLADELQQPAARMVILRVGLEVFGQVVDALAEERNLNFRGAGIGVVSLVRADDVGLAILVSATCYASTNGPENGCGCRTHRARRNAPPHQTAVVNGTVTFP